MHFLKNAPDTQDFSTVLNPAPPLDRMLGEGILMLVRMVKVSLDGCFAATILLYPALTGQDARGGEPNASTFAEGQP